MTKTVAEKLVVKPADTLWLSHPDRADLIGPLPAGASPTPSLDAASVAVVFADDAASVREILTDHKDGLATPGVLWIAYPKANRTDINRDSLWPILHEYGLRPVSQVSVDEVWSALRFRPLKPGEVFHPGND